MWNVLFYGIWSNADTTWSESGILPVEKIEEKKMIAKLLVNNTKNVGGSWRQDVVPSTKPDT